MSLYRKLNKEGNVKKLLLQLLPKQLMKLVVSVCVCVCVCVCVWKMERDNLMRKVYYLQIIGYKEENSVGC